MIERLFQILITDSPVNPTQFSSELTKNIASLKALYPNADHTLYDDAAIRAFLAKHHPPKVLAAYTALTPYAFKADLARYCLLYTFGGLYSDLSYLHLRALPSKSKTAMIVFRDVSYHPPWATSNSILYAKPQHPALKRVIDRILTHHADKYYGTTPLDPTGPFLLGRMLAQEDDWQNTVFGDSPIVSKEKSGRTNILKIDPNGKVIAIRTKTKDGSIGELVPGLANNYNDLWSSRRIWGEPEPRVSGREKLMARLFPRRKQKK